MRCFEVRFRGTTPRVGPRVHIVDTRNRTHLFFPYAPGSGRADEQAIRRLNECNISCDGISEFAKGTLLLSKDLTTPLK